MEIRSCQSMGISRYENNSPGKKPEDPGINIKDGFSAGSAEPGTKEISKFRKGLTTLKNGAVTTLNVMGIVAENLFYAMGGGLIGAAGMGLIASFAAISPGIPMVAGAVIGAGANIALHTKKYENLPEEIGTKAGEATGEFLNHVSDKIADATEIPAKTVDLIGKAAEKTQDALVAGTELPAKLSDKIGKLPDTIADKGPKLIEATFEKFVVEPVQFTAFAASKIKEAISPDDNAK